MVDEAAHLRTFAKFVSAIAGGSDVALTARKVLGVPRIHQVHLQTSVFENVVYGDPIHASGLHRDCPNAALLQPSGHGFQLSRGASEASHRLVVAARRYRHIVGFVADINARGIGMEHFQAEVFALDFPHCLPPLLAVHLVPMALRWMGGCLLAFLLWLLGSMVLTLTSYYERSAAVRGEPGRRLALKLPFRRSRPSKGRRREWALRASDQLIIRTNRLLFDRAGIKILQRVFIRRQSDIIWSFPVSLGRPVEILSSGRRY